MQVVIQPRVVAVDLPDLDKIIKKLAYWLDGDLYAFGITFTNGQSVLEELAITSELWLEEILHSRRRRSNKISRNNEGGERLSQEQ